MSGMIDRGKYASLAEALADVADIDKVIQAVAREAAIRDGMAATGESREIVAEVVDAATSMDHEAVLALLDGNPTTLGRGLARYVEELDRSGDAPGVAEDLDRLLKYPWPGAGPSDQDVANFRRDVAITMVRRMAPTPKYDVDEVSAEIAALAKDRFGSR